MLHTPTSSPRRGGNCSETVSGSNNDIDPARGRSITPRDHTKFQQRQRNPHHPPQRARMLYKNTPAELPGPYFPPHIQEHGRWETNDGFSPFGGARYAGPRRGVLPDKDLHSLPVLKPTVKNFFDDVEVPVGEGVVPEEKYRAQLRAFPELPQLVHERIREFGNEIVSCYSVQLCKFLNDALIETTPNSYAVLTKKNRTCQRWLMVFRSERGRINISFNKLLTNQLLVRCLNPVSVEVEPARGFGNTAQETCVFTFSSHTEANKFVHDIHESQTIVWNHREMFLEQTLRGGGPNPMDYYMEGPANFGFYSPRPLSARSSTGYYLPPDLPPVLTPRMKVLPPVPSRPKRSPFTVSARSTTPRADMDENWRQCCDSIAPGSTTPVAELTVPVPASPSSVTQSPMRKRSKGSSKDNYSNAPNSIVGGDGDFVYNSLTHAMALQQNGSTKGVPTSASASPSSSPAPPAPVTEGNPKKEVTSGRRFQVTDILVSNKRDVGTGAPDEEFFSLGSGELQLIDNGEDNFDEIKCYTTAGELMFSQILFGWNKVRYPDGSHKNPKTRWWIGAAVLGSAGLKTNITGNSDTPRIREFKATFFNDDAASKFADLFQEGAVKGNNPEVRKRYLAQSLRI